MGQHVIFSMLRRGILSFRGRQSEPVWQGCLAVGPDSRIGVQQGRM